MQELEIVVPLLPAQCELIMRPVEGSGGFQDLLRHIQDATAEDSLILRLSEVERIVTYVNEYGQGGFQERPEVVLDAIRRVRDATKLTE